MKQETRNLVLAMGLSILVLVGWQYFIGGPAMERQREAQQRAAQASPPKPADPATGAPANIPAASPNPNGGAAPTAPQAFASREEALKQSPRIAIDTPSLFGSIALKGARIDDLSLRKYRETVDPNSANIVLLSPSGAPQPYYAELGFVPAPGAPVVLPGAETLWQADRPKLTADQPVMLTWDNGQGLVFRRTIAVDRDYLFTVSDSVENRGSTSATIYPFALVSRHGRPQTAGYAVLHEGLIGLVGDAGVQEYTYDKIEKEPQGQKTLKGTGGWLGFTDKYWATVVAPDQAVPFDGRFSVAGATDKFYQTDALAEGKTIAPGASADMKTYVFAGAKVSELLDRYEANPGLKKFDLMIDWGWFYFMTRPMFRLIDFIYRLVGNFGIAILIVTVLVKLAFLPLANRSYLSMAKMKALQPEIKKLQELYPDDKAKQQQEQMALFKREKVNPVSGCLPIAIQIPVFFSLYKVLFVTIDLRQAPFFGWIHDLSQPDPTNIFNLFGLLPIDPTHMPIFGSFLHLGVWPLIMGFSMWVQMKMNPEPADPVQKTMFAWMPVIFTFTLGSFPVGLVIYWTWNNTLSVAQQWYIMRRAGVKFELWDNLAKTFSRAS
jgi:YidC/Oxa1 family membrane protein insertase